MIEVLKGAHFIPATAQVENECSLRAPSEALLRFMNRGFMNRGK